MGGQFYFSGAESMVHHKFCIIDDRIVVTGSYNWTYYAEHRNWENIMIVDEGEVVKGYIREFEKITQHHEKVDNVTANRKLDLSMNSNEYLISDYSFQAQKEIQKGNNISAAKILTESLKINNKQLPTEKLRNSLVQKINEHKFEVCPFEIGIHFLTGYRKIIPAFSRLPITKMAIGSDPVGNSKSLQITIEKYDYINTILCQFSMQGLKPCPINTQKIQHTLKVDSNGILTITCLELNGYRRVQEHKVDLKGV